ncbi:hypothetical protein BJ138DRAFT_1073587 [Hygrophoropsis aurantiaca]|uniref:Uncharacterized protein n=1 Tax=Hygrophoropsis aurantiaca TaxID=72124 RepID=A0ACB7ZU89_9AGAM|nr:hypothetical protein BJ138DRAFT_1073587 [Hygrophoropsis aurantiaca]
MSNHVSGTSTSRLTPESTPTVAPPDHPAAPISKTGVSPSTSSPSAETSRSECRPLDHRQIRFQNGVTLTFTSSDVPDPVAISFADNIPRLNAMWDDTAPHWGHESVLHVKGVPVPIAYWPDLYKYWKGDQWKGTKKKWYEWKVVVHRWREAGSPDAFWESFSANGKRMTFTAITKQLREERMEADKRDAARARVEHAADFGEKYKYRQGANWYTLTDDTAIANRFRLLQTQTNILSST